MSLDTDDSSDTQEDYGYGYDSDSDSDESTSSSSGSSSQEGLTDSSIAKWTLKNSKRNNRSVRDEGDPTALKAPVVKVAPTNSAGHTTMTESDLDPVYGQSATTRGNLPFTPRSPHLRHPARDAAKEYDADSRWRPLITVARFIFWSGLWIIIVATVTSQLLRFIRRDHGPILSPSEQLASIVSPPSASVTATATATATAGTSHSFVDSIKAGLKKEKKNAVSRNVGANPYYQPFVRKWPLNHTEGMEPFWQGYHAILTNPDLDFWLEDLDEFDSAIHAMFKSLPFPGLGGHNDDNKIFGAHNRKAYTETWNDVYHEMERRDKAVVRAKVEYEKFLTTRDSMIRGILGLTAPTWRVYVDGELVNPATLEKLKREGINVVSWMGVENGLAMTHKQPANTPPSLSSKANKDTKKIKYVGPWRREVYDDSPTIPGEESLTGTTTTTLTTTETQTTTISSSALEADASTIAGLVPRSQGHSRANLVLENMTEAALEALDEAECAVLTKTARLTTAELLGAHDTLWAPAARSILASLAVVSDSLTAAASHEEKFLAKLWHASSSSSDPRLRRSIAGKYAHLIPKSSTPTPFSILSGFVADIDLLRLKAADMPRGLDWLRWNQVSFREAEFGTRYDRQHILRWTNVTREVVQSWAAQLMDAQEGILFEGRAREMRVRKEMLRKQDSEDAALGIPHDGGGDGGDNNNNSASDHHIDYDESFRHWKDRNCGGTSCYLAPGTAATVRKFFGSKKPVAGVAEDESAWWKRRRRAAVVAAAAGADAKAEEDWKRDEVRVWRGVYEKACCGDADAKLPKMLRRGDKSVLVESEKAK